MQLGNAVILGVLKKNEQRTQSTLEESSGENSIIGLCFKLKETYMEQRHIEDNVRRGRNPIYELLYPIK